MQGSLVSLIWDASLVVKGVLLVLGVFSIYSWGIILSKYFYLSSAAEQSASLWKAVDTAKDPKDLLKTAEGLEASPLAGLVRRGFAVRAHHEPLKPSLRRCETQEAEKLTRQLTFLATTGATAPFIGLLGTVWGIMEAFRGIGATGSASLAVVAPGIAEALVTTAAGLAAAIPAVMAYNFFVSRTRKMAAEMEDFSELLAGLLEKGR